MLTGGCFGGAGFILRLSPFSDVYMTATLVDGEFIVPVSDHPIAMNLLVTGVEPSEADVP